LNEGRFHRHLQDIYAPLVVRYVDLMESSIGQSIHKGLEKENWKNKGQGCLTSEDMLWKLDALQTFIKNLHWPDEVFGDHLEHRLKQMASEMIEACATRITKHFSNWMNKGIMTAVMTAGTDYLLPTECCVMINVIVDCKMQALKLTGLSGSETYRYHAKLDTFLEKCLVDMNKQLVNKLQSVLDGLLKKLSRYDEGSFISSILSLTVNIESFSIF
jgi:calcium-dependent secretion activator